MKQKGLNNLDVPQPTTAGDVEASSRYDAMNDDGSYLNQGDFQQNQMQNEYYEDEYDQEIQDQQDPRNFDRLQEIDLPDMDERVQNQNNFDLMQNFGQNGNQMFAQNQSQQNEPDHRMSQQHQISQQRDPLQQISAHQQSNNSIKAKNPGGSGQNPNKKSQPDKISYDLNSINAQSQGVSGFQGPIRQSQRSMASLAETQSEQFACSVQYNEVYVWGDNSYGQLGLGSLAIESMSRRSENGVTNSTSIPKICCFNTVVSKVSCGMAHTLMLSASGHVYSMGSNQYGQLGLNSPFQERDTEGLNQVFTKLLPCLVESLQGIVISDIAAGNDHCLALTESGDKVFSWGQGKYGALGTSKSQNFKIPVEVDKDSKIKVDSIAAGARHSAFICRNSKRDVYMFGHATSGQLGLGEDCTDKAFKPEKVVFDDQNIQVKKIALGESHSLILTTRGHLLTTGANDKYQLGIDPEKRNMKLFSFTEVVNFKTGERYEKYQKQEDIKFKDIECWNLNAAIDQQDRVYLWGILHDKQAKQSLCIKIPERVNSFRVQSVAIGPTMAMLIDIENQQPCVIGVNAKGELGLGDTNQRKTFCVLNELREKKIKYCDIGKSGFVIALSEDVIDPGLSEQQNEIPTRENAQQNYQYFDPKANINQWQQAQSNQIAQMQARKPEAQRNLPLDQRFEGLQAELKKKQQIIIEGDRRHNSLLDKIQQLENRLENLDKKQQLPPAHSFPPQHSISARPPELSNQDLPFSPQINPDPHSNAYMKDIYPLNRPQGHPPMPPRPPQISNTVHNPVHSSLKQIRKQNSQSFVSNAPLQEPFSPNNVDSRKVNQEPSFQAFSSQYGKAQMAYQTIDNQRNMPSAIIDPSSQEFNKNYNPGQISARGRSQTRIIPGPIAERANSFHRQNMQPQYPDISDQNLQQHNPNQGGIQTYQQVRTKSRSRSGPRTGDPQHYGTHPSALEKEQQSRDYSMDPIEKHKIIDSVIADRDLQLNYAKRDKQARDYEERCQSLTQKVDSLVKFLEEERSVRKAAEAETHKRDKKILELETDLNCLQEKFEKSNEQQKELSEKLLRMKEENDRLKREKVENVEDRQQSQYKILDLESRLRAQKQQNEIREKEFERCTKEKYDAQNRQFLLQQEFNENTNKHFDLLRSNNENGYDVQKRLIDNQKSPHQPSSSFYERQIIAPSPYDGVPRQQDQYAGNGQRMDRSKSPVAAQDTNLPYSHPTFGSANVNMNPDSNHKLQGFSDPQSKLQARDLSDTRKSPHIEKIEPFSQTQPNNGRDSMIPDEKQRSAPPKEKNYEFSYQKYQDRTYDFMHKKIGESDTERADHQSQNLQGNYPNDMKFKSNFGNSHNRNRSARKSDNQTMGRVRFDDDPTAIHRDKENVYDFIGSRQRSRDCSGENSRPLRLSRDRVSNYSGLPDRERSRSKEMINERSRSFERSFNSGHQSAAHSQYLKQNAAGQVNDLNNKNHLSKSDQKNLNEGSSFVNDRRDYKRSDYNSGTAYNSEFRNQERATRTPDEFQFVGSNNLNSVKGTGGGSLGPITQPASFRSRIEGLLPERLKNQYDQQQRGMLDKINEEGDVKGNQENFGDTQNTLDYLLTSNHQN